MSEKILFVDDDIFIRRAYARRLEDLFQLETAADGAEGLQILEQQGPFAVVVSDMRMPGMNGIEFLLHVKTQSPDSVRMILTGNADMQTAIDAVNEGNVFRFMTKPCPAEILANALSAGLKQYQLVTAERELLGKTLNGSIQVLTEILSLVNPVAFSQSSRIRRIVRDIAAYLKLPNPWQFELAAMLSHIGCVTVPPAILDKVYAGQPLADDEAKMFFTHPAVARSLLNKIPRLDLIGRMIEGQHQGMQIYVVPQEATSKEEITGLGAQLLKLALDFDQLAQRGLSHQAVILTLRKQEESYNPHLLQALTHVVGVADALRTQKVMVKNLLASMIIEEDIWSDNDQLLVHKGQELTDLVLARLRNFAERVGVKEPVIVRNMLYKDTANDRFEL